MPFPRQVEIEVPLLAALVDLGGEAKPRDVYPLVAARFPQLTLEEQEERLENFPSTRKWSNLVQWIRQRLVDLGQVDKPQHGIWRITDEGRARLARESSSAQPLKPEPAATATPPPALSLRDLVNAGIGEIKGRLLGELKDLTPTAFEHFCKEFLAHLGYRNVQVTRKSPDGGIDGHGDFRQGAVSIRSAFQAKRWAENTVGRPEVDQFRGAIQGDYDHGVFLTTSRFSEGAMAASTRKGAITIMLLDGNAIVDLMLERGLGVRKAPLYVNDEDEEFFDLEDQ